MAMGESIEHIFASGQLAKEIWGFFGAVCGIGLPRGQLRDRAMAWWLSKQSEVQKWLVVSILPSFICWHIWKVRNIALWEGIRLSSGDICHGIF